MSPDQPETINLNPDFLATKKPFINVKTAEGV